MDYSGRGKHGHGHCGGAARHLSQAKGVCAGRQSSLGDVRGHDFAVEQGGDAEGGGAAIDWWVGRGGVPKLFRESGNEMEERGEEEDGGVSLSV